ncbi:MAG: YihY/virulence factor BrkB family protein, partial [Bacteroidales bacterium]|nr:YihY/virulence factor BrkB family protein [Bacteroidales bacterium]
MLKLKKYKILNNSIVKFSNKAKKISFPGFEKIPIYYVIKFFFSGISKGYIATRASSIAFNLALAIFPAIIFLFTLIPFIPINNLQTELLDFLQGIMPTNAFNFLETTLINVLTKKNSGILSFGLLSSLLFSTNALHALIQAFNNTYHSIETRKWLAIRTVSIVLVLIFSLLITTSVLLITFSQTILNKLVEL